MSTTIMVDINDDLPAFVGLVLDEDGHVSDALYGLRTQQLNLLAHIIAAAQTRVAAPRRKANKPPRDETLLLPMSWLKAVTKEGHQTTKDRMANLAVTQAGRALVEAHYADGLWRTTVAQAYCYPPLFVRVGLPLPVGDTRAYLCP